MIKNQIKSIRGSGSTSTYPAGCFEVFIEFLFPRAHPNINLLKYGDIVTYQGLSDPTLPGVNIYTGVIGYYNGQPNVN